MSKRFKEALQVASSSLKRLVLPLFVRGGRRNYLAFLVVLLLVCAALAQAPAPSPPADAAPSAAVTNVPAIPEPPLPSLSEDAVPPLASTSSSPAPAPTVQQPGPIGAQPVPVAEGQPSPSTNKVSSSPFGEAAASSPQAAPAYRATGVDFPTPAARIQDEPLVSIGRPVSRTNFGDEGNRQASRLRSMPQQRFTFDRASLRDVLRYLAEAAGIPYVGIPEHSPQAQSLVTFRMTASPFVALESVARQNDIKLTFDDGVWFMRLRDPNFDRTQKVEDENELIGVIYQLRNDPGDRVAFGTEGASGTSSPVSGSMGSSMGQPMQSGTTGTGGQSGPSSPQLPLQNSQYVFTTRAPKIVNDIRIMLGLKPLIYNENGTVEDPDAGGGSQASRSPIPPYDGSSASDMGGLSSQSADAASPSGGLAALTGGAPASGKGSMAGRSAALSSAETGSVLPVYVPPQKPQVIYNADNNLIWVVATRKQHKWVAEYLANVDQPQELIAIEVKFVETKKNPQYDFGINWGNMLGTGITVRGTANAGVGGEYRFGFDREKAWGATNSSESGFDNGSVNGNSILGAISNAIIHNQTNITITDIINNAAVNSLSSISSSTNSSFNRSSRGSGSTTANLDFRGQNTTVPYEAVLSLDEVSLTLQAFMQDRDTSVVQYPRVLTINNREVAITSAENTPVNAGVSQTQSGSTATQTGTLGYLPIGTQINILPKVVGDKKIALSVAVTISSIVGTVPINLGTGLNEYPITTERVYNATLQVDSGYTLAVGGLEKVDDRDVQGGVPVLKDIPGLGQFFKNKNKARNRVNLIIFMTPYIISDTARNPGIGETPVSIVPQRPGQAPEAPTFTPDGRIVGGEAGIANAFAWLEYQLRYHRQITEENMTNLESIDKLRSVISVARVFLADLQAAAGPPPYGPGNLAGDRAMRAENLLTDLNRALAAAQEDIY